MLLRLLLAVSYALVFAGCSSEDTASEPNPDVGSAVDADVEEPAPDAAPAESPAASDPAAGPSRIVTGNQLLLDPALALGLPVAAVVAPADRDGIPPYLADRATGVEVVAATPEPNYEQLLELAPDLIVVPEEAAEEGVLALLEDIATTVTTPGNTATPWPDVLRELAERTDRESEAADLLARWDERVEEFRAATGDAADLEVSLVRCFRDSCRYLPGATSFAGFVLDQLGVARPEIQRSDPEGRPFVEVSLEQIDLLDGDVIVLFGSDADDAIAALEASPLWAQLDAVEDGRVYRADPFAWFQGSVIAAGVIADELQTWLSGS